MTTGEGMGIPEKYRDLYETVTCNLCGSSEYVVKYHPTVEVFDPTTVFGASNGIMGTQYVVKCSRCGLLYVNPRLKAGIIVDSYVQSKDELYASQAEGRERTFQRNLRIVERYAACKGKILDVGAAAGFFLNVARKSGWQPYGVEPSRWLSAYGREKLGIDIQQGTLRETDYPDGYFDVVTMWDVLEHVTDPLCELREVRRILKKGGILIINYPDIGTWMAKLTGRHWWFLLSVHLTYFSSDTLKLMLGKAGFEPIRTGMHFQTLSLGHLIKMVGIYNQTLSRVSHRIARIFRLERLPIPYYASQTNMISRRV
jgi:2-polyprenyl-3-methyl-5-hydroxy-6-metoxy-1,4-benzoquinol methylase